MENTREYFRREGECQHLSMLKPEKIIFFLSPLVSVCLSLSFFLPIRRQGSHLGLNLPPVKGEDLDMSHAARLSNRPRLEHRKASVDRDRSIRCFHSIALQPFFSLCCFACLF